MPEGRRRWLGSLGVILIAAALLRAIALLGFEGLTHDGTTRVLTAQAWMTGSIPLFGRTNWPEGNYWLPALAMWIWREPYWSVRILYAVVGVANVWLVFHLGRTVLGRRSGVVAAWIVALMPFHIMMSADAATSEIPYICFALLSLLAAARYAIRPSPWWAAGAGLALTLSTLFRIDGAMWGIPIAIALASIGYARRMRPSVIIRDLALFGVCGLLYPVALLVTWASLYPDPFYIIGQAKLNAHQFFINGKHPRWPEWLYQSYVVAFWPASILVLMTPVIGALGWVGAVSATRQRNLATRPLLLGVIFVSAWLAYTAFKHDILAQWRYSLLFAVVLSVFCLRGAEAVASRMRFLSLRRIAIASVLGALLIQGGITYVTYVDAGSLTRQLGLLSPIRPDQFGSRDMLAWVAAQPPADGPVLLTPHVMEQPYLALHRAALEASGRIVVQSYYLPKSELVHTMASLKAELHDKLLGSAYLATSTSLRQLGLRDGLTREVVQPVRNADGTYEWEGTRLRLVRQFGSNRLWRILHQ